jgi:hypothetical protein
MRALAAEHFERAASDGTGGTEEGYSAHQISPNR